MMFGKMSSPLLHRYIVPKLYLGTQLVLIVPMFHLGTQVVIKLYLIKNM